MHSRRTARAAVISTVVLVLAAIAAPALAGHDDPDGPYSSDESGSEDYGSDERAGRSPDIDIQVECATVDVTSPRKISTVTVYFADGTEEIVEVDEREYSGTFDNTIDHALAESHNEMAVDHAEDCEPEPSPSPSDPEPDGNDTEAERETQSDDTQNDGTQEDATQNRTADSDGDRTGAGSRTATKNDGTTTSGDGTAAAGSGTTSSAVSTPSAPVAGSTLVTGGNTHVLGMAFHQGLKECPSGPHKGMPYLKLSDCGDSVLGIRLALTGAGVGWFAVLGIALVGIGTMLLRFRRDRVAA